MNRRDLTPLPDLPDLLDILPLTFTVNVSMKIIYEIYLTEIWLIYGIGYQDFHLRGENDQERQISSFTLK